MTARYRFLRTACWMAAGAFALAAHAYAQTKADKFVVSGNAAKAIMSKSDISVETAKQLIQACEEYSKAGNFASSIVILNPSGSIVAALRMDGQVNYQFDGALWKAQ